MKNMKLLAGMFVLASASAALAQGNSQTNSQPNGMSGNNPAAASGNDNQAVATTDANAPQPAHGSNSFSRKQAMHRIAKHGFTDVKDLAKDDQGVWRGMAMQNGASAKVWLDYKGNVGTD